MKVADYIGRPTDLLTDLAQLSHDKPQLQRIWIRNLQRIKTEVLLVDPIDRAKPR